MLLTGDNPLLSRPTKGPVEASACAIKCTRELCDRVSDLVASSLAESTRRAYQSDLTHFLAWGGELPASATTVATYLADHSDRLSVATLVRRVATLSRAHQTRSLANPCRSELVRATLRGIKRTRGVKQQQVKPLLRGDLVLMVDRLGSSPREVRDRTLLLLGFAGGFRRSELVGLDHADVEHVRQGMIVTLRSSKTDQEGMGRKVGIPHGRTAYCPVAALSAWLAASLITAGPIFRPVDRHGHVQPDRLSGEAVALVLRERAADAGIACAGISGHSLRAGFATSAAQVGVSSWRIRQQTGHASDAMLSRYIRDAELFVGNAAGALL